MILRESKSTVHTIFRAKGFPADGVCCSGDRYHTVIQEITCGTSFSCYSKSLHTEETPGDVRSL